MSELSQLKTLIQIETAGVKNKKEGLLNCFAAQKRTLIR
jgi:hypothetical protein